MDTENLVVDAALQAFVNGNTEPIKGILRQTSRADYDTPKRFRFPTVEDCIFRTPAVCLLPKMNAARPRDFSPFEWEDNYAVLGNILLHAAACLPDHELARVLLEKGADVNSTNNQGLTALHTAVIQSDYELVRLLAENGADVRREGMNGETGLHLASKKSSGLKDSHYLDYKIIRLLLEKGADVNRADTSGKTALHLASEKSSGLKNSHYLDYKIIRLLLEKGADVNRADRRGRTALHIACLSRPSGVNSLDRKIIRLLLEKGADVTKANRSGKTALHIACETTSSVILEMLTFKSPASVLNLGDFQGNTPFDYACGTQSPEIVQLLLSRGSSVVAKGRCGPLFHAVSFSYAKYVMPIASMLLKAGAKIAPDLLITAVQRADRELRAGENFPRLATHYPTFLELCTMLIDHGCDINAVDKWVGQTALHIAVRTKQELLVRKLLISRNIDIDKRDSRGYTPLRCACENGCRRLVDLLLISGASLRGQDWETVFETWRSETTLNEKYKNLYNYIIDSSKKCSTLENLCYIYIRKNIRNVEKDAIKLGLSPLLVKRLQLKE